MTTSKEKETKVEASVAAVPAKKPVAAPASAAAMDAQFVAVIADAAKMYSESSGQSVGDFMKPPMRNLNDLKKQIDRQNEGFTAFRAKREGLFSALSAMLAPIETVGEIVVGPASEVFPPSQNIFSAVMYLINAANDVSDAYDTILELFVQLKVGLFSATLRMRAYIVMV